MIETRQDDSYQEWCNECLTRNYLVWYYNGNDWRRTGLCPECFHKYLVKMAQIFLQNDYPGHK